MATTRPELLYACVCLSVSPGDERYRRLIGKTASVPLYGHQIPILADEGADAGKGTGAVMCATFGDSTDARWYSEHGLPYREAVLPDGRMADGLPYREAVLPDGRMADGLPYVRGLRVQDARREIIRLLRERGLLLRAERITHGVGVHERCGREVELLPSRQWYIDLLSEKDRLLEAADRINWHPAGMKSRYTAWVENLKWDWCISRQRYFGVPFPVWYCKACGAPAFARPEQLPVNPLETAFDGVCSCGCEEFLPESAVFDTWVTSSVTPQINERLGVRLTPMSMRTHAHEIIRTWTFYTIVRSLYHTGDIPWKDLMICGFVLAKKGEKISKSRSNAEYEPKRLIASHSADALRYWTAGARLGTDTFFSPEELAIPRRFLTKLWNAARFAAPHLCAPIPPSAPALLPVDRWMLERTREATANASRLLYEYEVGAARREIDELFWKDFCDSYLELVKERLYEGGEKERQSAQYTLYRSLLGILRFYSPYVPHITEYIYQQLFRRHEGTVSVHRTLWEKPGPCDYRLLEFGERLKETLSAMRKRKSEQGLSMKAEIDILEVSSERCFEPWFRLSERDLLACSKAARIRFVLRE